MLLLTLKLLGVIPEEVPHECDCGGLLSTNYVKNDYNLNSSLSRVNCASIKCKVYESYKKLYDMFGKDDSFMKNLRK